MEQLSEVERGIVDMNIRLSNMPRRIAIDFDGVLSDGKHYLGLDGKLFYATHSRDNWAIAQLINWGFVVDLVTANDSPIVKKFAEARRMGYVLSRDKNLHTRYHIVVVDSVQDYNLIVKAEIIFVPMDCNLDIVSMVAADARFIRVPVIGGHGVIDYICTTKLKDALL